MCSPRSQLAVRAKLTRRSPSITLRQSGWVRIRHRDKYDICIYIFWPISDQYRKKSSNSPTYRSNDFTARNVVQVWYSSPVNLVYGIKSPIHTFFLTRVPWALKFELLRSNFKKRVTTILWEFFLSIPGSSGQSLKFSHVTPRSMWINLFVDPGFVQS